MQVKTHFEDHKYIIESELALAKSEIHIAVAWINFKEYYNIFHTLIQKKIKLNIICSDNRQNRSHLKIIDELRSRGAKIVLLKMPNGKNHMHHKFAVIDGQTVLNGSFNWSPNATRSFENLMVLRDVEKEATSFIQEFKKLEIIQTPTISGLVKFNKCIDCGVGEIINILVFSSQSSKYFETSGDIVHVCTECEFYTNDNRLITNNQLYMLIDSLGCEGIENVDKLNNEIFAELNQYINNGSLIHAIGQVSRGVDGFDNDYVNTVIKWKNKFVGNRVLDVYEEQDFDVFYDIETSL